ncbi:hypothetical protein HDU91_003750, partial [Kappamyces sp. JEL0680]
MTLAESTELEPEPSIPAQSTQPVPVSESSVAPNVSGGTPETPSVALDTNNGLAVGDTQEAVAKPAGDHAGENTNQAVAEPVNGDHVAVDTQTVETRDHVVVETTQAATEPVYVRKNVRTRPSRSCCVFICFFLLIGAGVVTGAVWWLLIGRKTGGDSPAAVTTATSSTVSSSSTTRSSSSAPAASPTANVNPPGTISSLQCPCGFIDSNTGEAYTFGAELDFTNLTSFSQQSFFLTKFRNVASTGQFGKQFNPTQIGFSRDGLTMTVQHDGNDSFVKGAQLESAAQNIVYGTFRAVMKLPATPGTCAS